MNIATILAGFAAVFGFVGAAYAWKASKIGIDPGWSFEPVDPRLSQMGWMVGTIKAFETAGSLNGRVAKLALVGCVFSGFSCVAGFFGW